MPDISMCKNIHCTLKEQCYRYRAIPNNPYQSWSGFEQDKNGNCDYFMEIYPTDMIMEINKENLK